MKNKTSNQNSIGANNYVEHSMNILDRIHELLELKFNGKQKDLALLLGKKESEISKWFNGVQNFTLLTISKLEEAFGESIIAVHTNDQNAEYVLAKSCKYSSPQSVRLFVSSEDGLYEKQFINTHKTNNMGSQIPTKLLA